MGGVELQEGREDVCVGGVLFGVVFVLSYFVCFVFVLGFGMLEFFLFFLGMVVGGEERGKCYVKILGFLQERRKQEVRDLLVFFVCFCFLLDLFLYKVCFFQFLFWVRIGCRCGGVYFFILSLVGRNAVDKLEIILDGWFGLVFRFGIKVCGCLRIQESFCGLGGGEM